MEVFYDEPAESKAGHADQEKSREAKTTVDKTADQPLAEENEDDVLTPKQVKALGFNGIKANRRPVGLPGQGPGQGRPHRGAGAAEGRNCLPRSAGDSDRSSAVVARGRSDVLVGSIDLDGTSQGVANILKLVDADSIKELEALEKELHAIGLRLREDVLKPIGPTWFLVEVASGETEQNSGGGSRGLSDHVLAATP